MLELSCCPLCCTGETRSSPASLANPRKRGVPAPLFRQYVFPRYFTPLHCHNKNDRGKNNYKDQGLHLHSRMGFTKPRWRTGKVEEEQTPKYFSSFLTHRNNFPTPFGGHRSHGCKPGVCLKTSFNTTVHQCCLLKPKQRRLFALQPRTTESQHQNI